MIPELAIMVTRKCDKHCRHCCNNSTLSGKHMPYQALIAILKNAKRYGIRRIYFTGGEPFLYADDNACFSDVARYAIWLGLDCTVMTGGATCNPIYIQIAKTIPAGCSLHLSVNMFHRNAKPIFDRSMSMFGDMIKSFAVTMTATGKHKTLDMIKAYPGRIGCVVPPALAGRASASFSHNKEYPNCCCGGIFPMMYDEEANLLPCSSVFADYRTFIGSGWKKIKGPCNLKQYEAEADRFCKDKCPLRAGRC